MDQSRREKSWIQYGEKSRYSDMSSQHKCSDGQCGNGLESIFYDNRGAQGVQPCRMEREKKNRTILTQTRRRLPSLKNREDAQKRFYSGGE